MTSNSDNIQSTTNKKRKISVGKSSLVLILTLVFMVATLVIGIFVFKLYVSASRDDVEEKAFDKYYAMITDDPKSSLWQSIYLGAYENGIDSDVYVELLGNNLSEEYSCEELMRIAIASHVDGIIVYADESKGMTTLIDEAVEDGIPVVTIYSDNTRSSRCSYVGISGYNIGCEYGTQIINIMKEKRSERIMASDYNIATTNITVLIDAEQKSSTQDVIISSLQDTLAQDAPINSEYKINIVPVDRTNAFSVEESIRDIFMKEDIPDIIVCLDELDTTCAYQAVVDYNMVGDVSILGYYDSETILNAIDRKVIYATISVDTSQMGKFCVDALNEYIQLGFTSQYFTADVTLIDKANIMSYMAKEDADE